VGAVSYRNNIHKPRHVVQKLLVVLQCDLVREARVLRESRVARVVGRAGLLAVPLAAVLARLDTGSEHVVHVAHVGRAVRLAHFDALLFGLCLCRPRLGLWARRFAAQPILEGLARCNIGPQRGECFFHGTHGTIKPRGPQTSVI
jgi:hypothetical protein